MPPWKEQWDKGPGTHIFQGNTASESPEVHYTQGQALKEEGKVTHLVVTEVL